MSRVLGMLVLLGLLLPACTAREELPDPVTLQVMMADDWAATDVVVDAVRSFEAEHPGVRVALVARPFSQIMEEAQGAMDAGQPLDVIHGHAFAVGANGLAEDLGRFYEDGTLDVDAYFPGALEDITWGGTRYGIPLDVNAMVQVVQGDTPPATTFADVRALATMALATGRRGLTVSANSWEVYGWIRANGGEVVRVGPDGTPEFLLDSPEVVQTMEFLGSLVDDGLAYGPLTRDVSTDAFELFSAGDTALLTTGTWDIAELDRRVPAPAYVTAPMPIGGTGRAAGTTLGGSSLSIGRGSTNVALAVQFVRTLTSDDNGVRLALEEGRFPARPALFDAISAAPGADVLGDQLVSASPMKLIAFPAATEAFAEAMEAILTGRAPAAEALARAQTIAEGSVTTS